MAKFYVVALRNVKIPNATRDQYAPRTINKQQWYLAGEFTSRKAKDKAVSDLISHINCLSVCVFTGNMVNEFKTKHVATFDDPRRCVLDALHMGLVSQPELVEVR